MADTIGYAGTEMVRRTVGDSKVAEISSVTDNETRIKLDKLVVLTGVQFINNRKLYKTGEHVVAEFERVVTEL